MRLIDLLLGRLPSAPFRAQLPAWLCARCLWTLTCLCIRCMHATTIQLIACANGEVCAMAICDMSFLASRMRKREFKEAYSIAISSSSCIQFDYLPVTWSALLGSPSNPATAGMSSSQTLTVLECKILLDPGSACMLCLLGMGQLFQTF